jgi:hypothetical protein
VNGDLTQVNQITTLEQQALAAGDAGGEDPRFANADAAYAGVLDGQHLLMLVPPA